MLRGGEEVSTAMGVCGHRCCSLLPSLLPVPLHGIPQMLTPFVCLLPLLMLRLLMFTREKPVGPASRYRIRVRQYILQNHVASCARHDMLCTRVIRDPWAALGGEYLGVPIHFGSSPCVYPPRGTCHSGPCIYMRGFCDA